MDDSEEEREMDTSITPCNFLHLSSLLFILSSVILTSKFLLSCVSPFFFTVGDGTSSSTPIAIGGSAHNADSPAIPQTPDDASFELAPSPALLKEQKETVKIILHEITHTLTGGNFTQLAYCRHAANNIFNMNWAPVDISP